ncbi:hypothetical protein G3N95_24135 [Paraburkholderia sp. Tr-20389]|uniref:KAP family P-loop NTPase fold protein n=1 Tax=Paraburkholderia sp. Tr-20389 TaxID=2703903 RepID=UPI0019826657|nr:P-loop NTPase fold protein [Paraburkholderia sp. Tr-20389]MBN3756053.1 hypothetical protein [Paraburkholderia sp. Tr-20389]
MVEATATNNWDLGSDLPLIDPASDEFGYAPFASQLGKAIVENSNPQGLVLAVHGKWGSGKSSLMNFIKHDLKELPESARPILIDFNPWWFEGREQIATQLLEQFSAQLPDRLKHVRTLAKLVATYSKQIASVAADYSGTSWIKGPLSWALGKIPGLKFLTEKTGVPQVKKKVAAALKASGKRFVFFVDDIDRLTPDEARDLFRAIKALADFPEVVYVLFFDRDEVADALSSSLKMNGEAYLEKIIQAPFHLPAVDKGRLQLKLFKGLDAILESRPMPFPFDQSRWVEVFSNGLDRCIEKPRDIVRVLNAISVVYPPLAGEVNPVDLIALEFLRLFEPSAYASIRDGKEFFCGRPTNVDYRKDAEKKSFEKWKQSLPEEKRERVVSLVGRLFPKVNQILRDSWTSSGGREEEWRKELRPCSPECFDVYFQFGVPQGHVTRAELERLVNSDTSEEMAALLRDSKDFIFPDGHSKARDLIDRLHDFDDLDAAQASKLITALISVSDVLLRRDDERGFLTFPNRWRIIFLITALLERIESSDRQKLLMSLAEQSPALTGLVFLADLALDAKKDPAKAPKGLLDLEEGFPESLAAKLGSRLNQASLEELLSMGELDHLVDRWKVWGDPDRMRAIFQPAVDDDRLLLLLEKFLRTGSSQTGKKFSETYHLSMATLGAVMNLEEIEPRILSLQARNDLTVRQRAAINRYLKGMQRIREGKDPDGFYLDDAWSAG